MPKSGDSGLTCDSTSAQVLSVRDSLKVIGVYARRLSAQMVKFETLGNRAFRSHVRLNVGKSARADAISVAEGSVAETVFRLLPDPTRTSIARIRLNPEVRVPRHRVGVRMTLAKSLGFPFHPSPVTAGVGGYRSRLSAAALAKLMVLATHPAASRSLTPGSSAPSSLTAPASPRPLAGVYRA
jgi:hypothetical protein